jgi:hypothetical protein
MSKPPIGRADHLALGTYNAICDRCGAKFKATDLLETWDGLMVCRRDWEPRHPQDYVRARKESAALPWVRPPSEGTYVIIALPVGDRTSIPTDATVYFPNSSDEGTTYELGCGTWPTGVTINPVTGLISGTPPVGVYTGLCLCVTWPNGQHACTPTFTLTIVEVIPPSWTIYTGMDINGISDIPLPAFLMINSSIAQAQFALALSSPGVEDFETQPIGPVPLVNTSFPKAGGGTINVTITGTALQVFDQPAGTAADGRYSIPSATSSRFLRVATTTSPGSVIITADQDIRAVGFYATDIGDFGGDVSVILKDSGGTIVQTFIIPRDPVDINNDGSVFFWGVVGGGSAAFRRVELITTLGAGDVIGVDRLQIQD